MLKLINFNECHKYNNFFDNEYTCYGIFDDFDNNTYSNDKNINENIKEIIYKEFKYKKIGDYIIIYKLYNIFDRNLILIKCGKKLEFDEFKYKNIINKYIEIIKYINVNFSNNICFLTMLDINNKNYFYKLRITLKIIRDKIYCFSMFKSEYKKLNSNIYLVVENKNKLEKTFNEINIISDAVDISKDLGNTPANICNTNFILDKCIELCVNNSNILHEYLDYNKMKKIGMNAYLHVSMGSKNKPIMSILKYNGLKLYKNINSNPIILIGKGLTFDTGGISLKNSNNMDEMKFDMCGAASVFSTIYSISKLKLPINVIGILATCENSIGSKSYRPGDIIRTFSNKTIEVLNTDAEGRLVLCDAIHYSYKFNPLTIIDIATLTGACVIALGKIFSGLISNNNILLKKIIKSSKEIDDKVWQLPLVKENQYQIKSNIADIKNIGDGNAGAITAACFLYNFIKKDIKWAHIDIAGTAYDKNNMSTGRPTYLLTQFLINESKKFNNKNNEI